MTNANIDFNKGIDVVALIEKLDEALEPFYAPSKVLPNDIETTLRDARICLKCYLDIIKHRDAEIENLKGIVNRQRSVLISRHFEILRLREKVASLKERNGGGRQMTDNEIMNALECCTNPNGNDCYQCPKWVQNYDTTTECGIDLMADTLKLITRQKAEIERLQKQLNNAEDLVNEKTIQITDYLNEIERLNKEIYRKGLL